MAGDEDYEHWPSSNSAVAESVAPAQGYDSNNGLHTHSYIVTKDKSPSPDAATAPAPTHVINYPQPVYYARPPNMMAHPQAQYYSHPVYSVPPGYYQPYPAAAPAPAAPAMPAGSGNSHVYIPAYDASKCEPATVSASAQPNAWLGRTKAQVEEDNMKIAKKEGAYDKRKVAPVDLKDDQMCWVVETDGSHSLRMCRDIKEMSGEWKEDPRYKDAWYFVREEKK